MFELLTIKLFAVFLRFCRQMGIFRDRHDMSGKIDFQVMAAEFTEIRITAFDGLSLNSISLENLCHDKSLIAWSYIVILLNVFMNYRPA